MSSDWQRVFFFTPLFSQSQSRCFTSDDFYTPHDYLMRYYLAHKANQRIFEVSSYRLSRAPPSLFLSPSALSEGGSNLAM